MSYQDRTTSTLESAQTVLTYLLRDPVKEAVREALREEAAVVSSDGPERDEQRLETSEERAVTDSESDSYSKLPLAVLLVTAGGAAYLLRRRRSNEPEYTQDRFEEEDHGVDTEPSVATADEQSDESVSSVSENS